MEASTTSGTPSSGDMYTASDDLQTCTDEHTCTGYTGSEDESDTDSAQMREAEEIGHLLKNSLSTVSTGILH